MTSFLIWGGKEGEGWRKMGGEGKLCAVYLFEERKLVRVVQKRVGVPIKHKLI